MGSYAITLGSRTQRKLKVRRDEAKGRRLYMWARRNPKNHQRTRPSRAPDDADEDERRGRWLWARDVKEKKQSRRIGCEREKRIQETDERKRGKGRREKARAQAAEWIGVGGAIQIQHALYSNSTSRGRRTDGGVSSARSAESSGAANDFCKVR